MQSMTQSNSSRIDRMLERMHKEEELRCPHCGHVHEGEDTWDHISYCGEDPPKEETCSSCEETFWVEEIVRRTYECTKTDPYGEEGKGESNEHP